jgi:RNA polymerase sigma-32 factor
MQAIEEGDLSPDKVKKIATTLGVTEDDVVQMNRRLAGPDASLNAPLRSDGESEWQDWLVDHSDNQETTYAEAEETSQRRELLNTALQTLTERERHILEQRRLIDEPKTLEDLSHEYGISRERVRQIEVRAFEKLQKAIRNAAARIAGQSVPALETAKA